MVQWPKRLRTKGFMWIPACIVATPVANIQMTPALSSIFFTCDMNSTLGMTIRTRLHDHRVSQRRSQRRSHRSLKAEGGR